MDKNTVLRHRIFSDKVLKEVAGKKIRRDKIKVEEIADTHTIDVASMTLILGRIEELYKVAAKLNKVGLTAAAVEIEEPISEIEKAILSNPVIKEEKDTFDNDAIIRIMEQMGTIQSPSTINTTPIGTPPIQDGGSGDVIWRMGSTSAGTSAPDYGNPGTPMVGYSLTSDTANRNGNDYTEAMRRAYDRLNEDSYPTPTRASDPDYDE